MPWLRRVLLAQLWVRALLIFSVLTLSVIHFVHDSSPKVGALWQSM